MDIRVDGGGWIGERSDDCGQSCGFVGTLPRRYSRAFQVRPTQARAAQGRTAIRQGSTAIRREHRQHEYVRGFADEPRLHNAGRA